jgi:hypothetical protein
MPCEYYSDTDDHGNLKPHTYVEETHIARSHQINHMFYIILLPAHGGFPYRRRK